MITKVLWLQVEVSRTASKGSPCAQSGLTRQVFQLRLRSPSFTQWGDLLGLRPAATLDAQGQTYPLGMKVRPHPTDSSESPQVFISLSPLSVGCRQGPFVSQEGCCQVAFHLPCTLLYPRKAFICVSSSFNTGVVDYHQGCRITFLSPRTNSVFRWSYWSGTEVWSIIVVMILMASILA